MIFQSTLPAGGATYSGACMGPMMYRFQSTLPAGGATSVVKPVVHFFHISIHTPRGGSDVISTLLCPITFYFNPHSPRGERRSTRRKARRNSRFQSTLPAGGATEADLYRRLDACKFQSTLPAGGATVRGVDARSWNNISIHTPRGGSDALPPAYQSKPSNFNPHSPRGERRKRRGEGERPQVISIHTPRGGSDNTNVDIVHRAMISIHTPRGGSDKSRNHRHYETAYFNPHSPRGERRRHAREHEPAQSISIHTPRGESDDIPR